jgi:hypothetical protein
MLYLRLIAVVSVSTMFLSIAEVGAQTSDPATKAILDALQRIDGRLDGMQREIDQMKRGPSAPAPAQTPTRQAPAAQQAPTEQPRRQLQPGWVVNVYNQDGNGNAFFDQDPIGTFIYRGVRFHSQIHAKSVPTNNRVGYEAKGFIRIRESGRYVFFFRSSADWSNCGSLFQIDDKELIKTEARVNLQGGQSWQAGIDLAAGDFAVTYRFACGHADQRYSERAIDVRGPGDLVPRELRPDEILHIARADRRSSNETPAATGQGGPLAPVNAAALIGSQRTVQRAVNVRRQPSTNAQRAAQLEPGTRIGIRAVTPDEEWAMVEVNGQAIGFIKVTALVASSS